MRAVKFNLKHDEVRLVADLMAFSDFKDLTPKQLFLRLIRNRLEHPRDIPVATGQKSVRGRPLVTVNGLEKDAWVAKRVAAYRDAELEAATMEDDYEAKEHSLVKAMAETNWGFAVEGKPVAEYLNTLGGKYTIGFPPADEEASMNERSSNEEI